MLTNERMSEIAEALGSDQVRIKKLVDMEPEQAAAELAKEGYDITAEELIAFGEKITVLASQDGEFNEESLENVSGGGLAFWRAAGTVLLIASRIW